MTAPAIELKSDELGPEGKPWRIWACPTCRLTNVNGKEGAERCCLCARCSGPREDIGWSTCRACRDATKIENQIAHSVKAMLLPLVDLPHPDYGDMVYVDNWDRWFHDLDEVEDYARDDELSSLIVHPSRGSLLNVPDLHDILNDAWGQEYGDDSWDGLSPEVDAILSTAMQALSTHRPEVFHAVTTMRVRL